MAIRVALEHRTEYHTIDLLVWAAGGAAAPVCAYAHADCQL